METYGKILLIAMPIFLVLVLFEKWYGWRKGQDTVRNLDMVSSLSSGITNVTKDVLGLGIVVLSYDWMEKHLALTHVPAGVLTYIIAFLALDFSGYWVHRIQHRVNIFWNAHIIHHSSEEFNLACALRQSISGIIKVFTFFLLPAALLGVPGKVIAIVAPLHLFAQFWYHTRHINKMGWLEHIIVTPSHHRVHHAINKEYLDKNFSQIFIFWDKLFGSFQEEMESVPPVYGITRPAATWNPVKINFQHLWLLVKDAWHTRRWNDKLKIWFMPTGWRPKDVEEKFPVHKIEDVYHFNKYDAGNFKTLHVWAWVQLTVVLLLISYLFGNIAAIGSPGMFIYGAFIFMSVYAFTELMDGNDFAVWYELVKNITGLCIIIYSGSWFGADRLLKGLSWMIGAYFVASSIATFWIHLYLIKLKSQIAL